MSTRRGGGRKPQKYQNVTAFDNQKYGTSDKLQAIAAAPVGAVCTRCADKIAWKKKFNKYKPLTAPGSCEICKQKKIRHAYHRICLECAKSSNKCAMCKTEGEIVRMPKSKEEKIREEQEEQARIAQMRERERRTLLRKKEAEEKARKLAEKEAREAEALAEAAKQ